MQSEKIEQAENIALMLHDDVTYGGGRKMSDQVERVAALVTGAVGNQGDVGGYSAEDVVTAAFLHKSLEDKRIHPDRRGIVTMDSIADTFGDDVAAILNDVASEPPEPEGQDKMDLWADKSDWALSLSLPAQIILLAEKVANFETSRDDPNPNWPVSRHKEYFESRLLMVEALKDASPHLYGVALQTAYEGLVKLVEQTEPSQGFPGLPNPPPGFDPSWN